MRLNFLFQFASLNMVLCCAQSLSCIQLFGTKWTVACQPPLSMRFSRQEHWSGLPCPPPGDLPNPVIESRSPTVQADSLPFEPPGKLENTGVGNLSLLQGNFPTQELNQNLLHCRLIPYQLSYRESLLTWYNTINQIPINPMLLRELTSSTQN